jgi:excisionase family DNA binding protein
MNRVNHEDERLAVSIAEAAQMVGMSVGYVRNEIASGRLKVARLGRRVLVRRDDLGRYLDAATGRSR